MILAEVKGYEGTVITKYYEGSDDVEEVKALIKEEFVPGYIILGLYLAVWERVL
jgi:hypothetical protein